MRIPISVYIALALAEMALCITIRRALLAVIIAYAAWRLI